jgi:hypothetical protein
MTEGRRLFIYNRRGTEEGHSLVVKEAQVLNAVRK